CRRRPISGGDATGGGGEEAPPAPDGGASQTSIDSIDTHASGGGRRACDRGRAAPAPARAAAQDGAAALGSRSRRCPEVGRPARADDRRVRAAADGAPGDPADGAADADRERNRGGRYGADATGRNDPRDRRALRIDARGSEPRSRSARQTDLGPPE